MRVVVPDVNVFMHEFFDVPSGEEHKMAARRLFVAAINEHVKLVIPQLFWSELSTAMLQVPDMSRSEFEDKQRLTRSLVRAGALHTARRTHRVLMAAFDISRLERLPNAKFASFLDASYHALARDLDGVFVTADHNYIRAVGGRVDQVMGLIGWEKALA